MERDGGDQAEQKPHLHSQGIARILRKLCRDFSRARNKGSSWCDLDLKALAHLNDIQFIYQVRSRNKLTCVSENKSTRLLHTVEKLFTTCALMPAHLRSHTSLRMWWELRACSSENAYLQMNVIPRGLWNPVGYLWIHYRSTDQVQRKLPTVLMEIACCWQWASQATLQCMQTVSEHCQPPFICKHLLEI